MLFSNLPGLFLCVIVHDRPQHHQLDAASLEQGDLVLLAQLGETVDLFGHFDNPLDGKLGEIDNTILTFGCECNVDV